MKGFSEENPPLSATRWSRPTGLVIVEKLGNVGRDNVIIRTTGCSPVKLPSKISACVITHAERNWSLLGLSTHVVDWKKSGWNAAPWSCARLNKNGASKELGFSKNPSSLAWSDGLQGRYKTLQRLFAGCDCHHLVVPQTRRQPLAY